jgi:hypothetical protein
MRESEQREKERQKELEEEERKLAFRWDYDKQCLVDIKTGKIVDV